MNHTVIRTIGLALAIIFAPACATQSSVHDSAKAAGATLSTTSVVPVASVKWEKLNPARGDKSPLAGTL